MTCSWSSLVCILASSSKEMSNTSWSLISCPVLLFPCCVTILPAEKLDTTTENREIPITRTSAEAESCLDYLWHEFSQHVCKYCSEVLKGQGSAVAEHGREVIYNSCSPGWNCWDLTLPVTISAQPARSGCGLTGPCPWSQARNNPAWGTLKKQKKAQSQLFPLHKTRGGYNRLCCSSSNPIWLLQMYFTASALSKPNQESQKGQWHYN